MVDTEEHYVVPELDAEECARYISGHVAMKLLVIVEGNNSAD
jgi:hypothetical protein